MSDPITDMPPSRIPEFASLEEEATFWDTHDTTAFEDEFHPVNVIFEEHLSDALPSKKIAIRLDAETDLPVDGSRPTTGAAEAVTRPVGRAKLPA